MYKIYKLVPVAVFCALLSMANLAMAKLVLGENETREDHPDGSITITSQNGNVTTKKNYSGEPGASISGCTSNKLKCIKAVREATGMGLKEAKNFVESAGGDTVDLSNYDAGKVKTAAENQGLSYEATPGKLQNTETYTDGQLTSRENYQDGHLDSTDHYQDGVLMSTTYPKNGGTLDCSGGKVQCIKAVKEAGGMGLKEAKDYVDSHLNGDELDVKGLDAGTRKKLCANGGCTGAVREDIHYNIQPNFTVPQAAQFIKDEGNEIGIIF